jgi:class 3 adenylate cyclase
LPFVSAKVPCLITQRTFSQRGGNGSSCPYSVIARPVKPFYDPRWGGWEIPLAGEQRRLAAIVAADVVGYSRLMGRDESGTRAPQIAVRREAFDLRISAHAYCAGMSMRGTQ